MRKDHIPLRPTPALISKPDKEENAAKDIKLNTQVRKSPAAELLCVLQGEMNPARRIWGTRSPPHSSLSNTPEMKGIPFPHTSSKEGGTQIQSVSLPVRTVQGGQLNSWS